MNQSEVMVYITTLVSFTVTEKLAFFSSENLSESLLHQYALCGRLSTVNTQTSPALGVGVYI